ncbi:SDR family oxidoreductase [Actinoplanes flavus]|nr:SDR family oxidoreductase [Actinoplanes flavus]
MTGPAPSMFSLHGRTALVTGSRGGIGRAIAVALARAGADLVLHGHTDDLAGVEKDVREAGGDATRWVFDLSDTAAIPAAVAGLPPVDILVNNAGIIRRAPAAEHTLDDWRAVLDVNLDAVFQLSRAIGVRMLARRRGKIISVASMLSFQGGVQVPGYTAAKHGVAGLTKALACEWAAEGVQVNAVAPGYIATDNTAALRADPVREPEIRSRIPAGRWGRPDDVAGAVIFLASAASDYVNGHVLAVDGGWLAR